MRVKSYAKAEALLLLASLPSLLQSDNLHEARKLCSTNEGKKLKNEAQKAYSDASWILGWRQTEFNDFHVENNIKTVRAYPDAS